MDTTIMPSHHQLPWVKLMLSKSTQENTDRNVDTTIMSSHHPSAAVDQANVEQFGRCLYLK